MPRCRPYLPATRGARCSRRDVRLDLAEGTQLRRVMVMRAVRVELTGFTDRMVERLKAMGLIASRLRLFVPAGSQGLAVLLERYKLTGTSERAAV